MSFSYGYLVDDWITNGASPNDPKKDAYPYVSRAVSFNECAYPRRCAVGSRRIVREYATNDGQGGVRRFGVRYRDGRYDRRGHGFLGFGERIVTDLDTKAETATFYDNVTIVKVGERDVYPFANQIRRQWRWAPALPNEPKQNRVELAFVDITSDVVPTNGGQAYFTLGTKRRTRRMQGTLSAGMSLESWVTSVATNENATMLRDTSVYVVDYDIFGNVLEMDVSTAGVDLTMHVARTVKNDVARWILGQMQAQTECSTAGGESRCRIVSRTTNEFGEVESESTSDKDIPDTKLTVEYDKRDKYGNVEHVTARDEYGHQRGTTTVFDEQGVFPVKEINALLHETALDYDQRFGALKKETNPNQLVTEWQYDSLGRETVEKRHDGSQTTTTLSRSKMDGVWRLSARTTTTGGDDDETIFDSLGRPARTFSHGPTPTGQKTPRRMQVFGYDRLSGKTAKRSVLTAEGTPDDQLRFDVSEFDSIGREIRHTTPWNAATTTTYDGFVMDSADTTTIPPRLTRTQLDVLGRPVIVTDAAKGKTSYTYGPFGTLRSATDPGGATTKWTLDALGQPRSIDDPDRGTTALEHDGFGELLTSTDALGRVVTFDVDELGREKTRTDKLGAQVETTTWQWDTAPNGIGRLHTVTSPDAIQSFSYSKRGQIEGMTLTVGNDSFAARQWYDDVGHLESMDYPQPLGVEPFGVMYERDEHGFVIGVHEKNALESFWTLTEVDNAGRTRKERFGNDVETTREYDNDKQTLKGISTTFGAANIQKLAYDYDERLNLKSRTDALQKQNKTERFRYDELDRVTCAYFGAVDDALAPCETSYSYHANGNLWEKSDVGTYSYMDSKHPHAVTHVVPGETYFYDAVGNQITRPGGVSMTYTPFDLPKTITKGGKTTSFGYDGDQQRIRKTTPNVETLYFGDIFEQVTSAGGIEHRFYVHSPERAIAVVTRGGAEPGTRFFHVDHLGSIDVITKENGTVDERRSYDAYGARRNPEWGKPSGVPTSRTTRGFTGHEEDDEFGLVNMKGRIMDPRLGRFTTTDPVIADIWNGQALNRYAYVNNNPLAFVDPTGFVPEDKDDELAPGRWTTTIVPEEPVSSGEVIVGSSTVHELVSASEPEKTKQEAAKVSAYVPPVDVNTTGPGGERLPQEITPPEPKKEGFWNGVGDGLGGLVDDFWSFIPLTPSWSRNTVDMVDRMATAYRQGDVIDAFNVINPLIPVANIALAVDDNDWYTVGAAAVSVGVAILSVVIAKKAPGLRKGPKTTRGPPKATKATSKIDRTAFKAEREAFWKAEAKTNPNNYTSDDLAKMQRGQAPTGPDGHPMELHHVDRTPDGGLTQMSRTDHRLGENYKKNHP